ncbi:13601_t:CDS:2 [Dentiscutata erythropus]|uniref:13601_t:CDS:1 n=1 Tax=Dentiscutata erythropus TaxID=1348616 RepID=A0A9N9IJV2_9GLOM|nr:13601_t:CDS:2 [Dentiscutata erythropus]
MSPPAPKIIATNTLIIANVNQTTFIPENLEKLKSQLEQYGSIYKLVPIKSFNRIFVTFYKTTDAKSVKEHFDKSIFLEKIIRVYFGQHTSIYETDNTRHLNVPETEKNLLISPPGSPPVGWIQSREDHPNSITLADDLIEPEIKDSHNDSRNHAPILTVIPSDTDVDNNAKYENNLDVPLILIQNWDDSPPPSTKTKKPSLQIYNNGKAQLRPNISLHQITPTPRPPLQT